MVTTSTVFAYDPQPIVVEGLMRVLDSCTDLRLVGHSTDSLESLEMVGRLRPDMVLFGQASYARPGLAIISQLLGISPESKVILWISELSEHDIFRAIQMGARGVAQKRSPVATLLECLRSVSSGRVWLQNPLEQPFGVTSAKAARVTPREREIVEQVCRGLKNREIAAALDITPGTVKVHLMHIFEKTGVRDRFQLALQGRQILDADGPLEMAMNNGVGR
jgi:two-component system nitrate/nitrite response regulator NarL